MTPVSLLLHSLQHTGFSSSTPGGRTLLRTLRFDPRAGVLSGQWPALTDDVLDGFISILTNGKITTDGVGAHGDLLTEFPYVGPPHRAATAQGESVRVTFERDWTYRADNSEDAWKRTVDRLWHI